MWLVGLSQGYFHAKPEYVVIAPQTTYHFSRTVLVPVLEFWCFLFSPKKVIYIAKQFLAVACLDVFLEQFVRVGGSSLERS